VWQVAFLALLPARRLRKPFAHGRLMPHACFVFRFAVFVACALARAAVTAASALLSPAGPLALAGTRG
jgi:hypothetical protein